MANLTMEKPHDQIPNAKRTCGLAKIKWKYVPSISLPDPFWPRRCEWARHHARESHRVIKLIVIVKYDNN